MYIPQLGERSNKKINAFMKNYKWPRTDVKDNNIVSYSDFNVQIGKETVFRQVILQENTNSKQDDYYNP